MHPTSAETCVYETSNLELACTADTLPMWPNVCDISLLYCKLYKTVLEDDKVECVPNPDSLSCSGNSLLFMQVESKTENPYDWFALVFCQMRYEHLQNSNLQISKDSDLVSILIVRWLGE